MEDKSNLRNTHVTSLFLFIFTYAFLVILNAVFPTQSDDIGRTLNGIDKAINSYLTWNGRFGELMLVTFGSYLSTTIYYAFINGFVGTCVLFLIYLSVWGRLPDSSRKSLSCFFILLAFVLFDPEFSFGSVFYWAAGSFNYLWAWFFLLLIITPCTLFWRNMSFSKGKNVFLILSGIPIGIIAGWSSEFGIVIIIVWIVSIIFAIKKNVKLPLWYYTTCLALILGWIILYACPGIRVRANPLEDYHSIATILKSGPIGIIKRCIETFDNFGKRSYFISFFSFSLFLILSSVFHKPSLKKISLTLLSLLVLLLCITVLPKFLYFLVSFLICIINVILTRKENQLISKSYIIICVILFLEFLFVGATIQIGIPGRAKFQCTILNYVLIAISMNYCFEIFVNNIKLQRIASISCITLTILLMSFVCLECMRMHSKWVEMEESIAEQKNQGNKNVVIDKNTFLSRYWNYGDWGNPDENPETWPNTTYSEYYDVNTLISQ